MCVYVCVCVCVRDCVCVCVCVCVCETFSGVPPRRDPAGTLRTRRMKGARRSSRSVLFWYWRIS